jgi:putative oxidoreductase
MRIQEWVLWTVRVLLAIAFLAAGASKLTGAEPMVATFEKIGVGQWFRYFTGLAEVAGALLLLIPATGFAGAAILLSTMVGATITHLFVIGGNPGPAIVLGVLAGFVAWRTNPLSSGNARAASIRQRITPTA